MRRSSECHLPLTPQGQDGQFLGAKPLGSICRQCGLTSGSGWPEARGSWSLPAKGLKMDLHQLSSLREMSAVPLTMRFGAGSALKDRVQRPGRSHCRVGVRGRSAYVVPEGGVLHAGSSAAREMLLSRMKKRIRLVKMESLAMRWHWRRSHSSGGRGGELSHGWGLCSFLVRRRVRAGCGPFSLSHLAAGETQPCSRSHHASTTGPWGSYVRHFQEPLHLHVLL